MPGGKLFLGFKVNRDSMEVTREKYLLKPSHLTTHGVIIGMTGSGKTGAAIVLIEELLLRGIPVLAVDPKGDLANLALRFPDLSPEDFEKWVDPSAASSKGMSAHDYAKMIAEIWSKGLEESGITRERLRELSEKSEVLILTPGSDAGTPVSILEGLNPLPGATDDVLEERARNTAAALIRLTGIEEGGDEEVFLSNLLLWAWRKGEKLSLENIIRYILQPPFDKIGVLDLDMVLPEKRRRQLAVELNRVIASPGFEDWLKGMPLDMDRLLWTDDGRPRAVVVYLAHLSDEMKMFAVTMILQALYTWMFQKGGTDELRALLYFDEVYGFIPPHPSNPPSKRLLLLLTKQARAFGVGVVLATQNPVDIDYKVLTNAGVWMIGRLQTENDIERVSEGLRIATGSGSQARVLIPKLPKRVFLVKDVKERELILFKTRWAMTYLRGPMTLSEISRLPKPRHLGETSRPEPRETVAEGLLQSPPMVYEGFDQAFLPAEPGATYRAFLYGRALVYISKSRPPVDVEFRVSGASLPGEKGRPVFEEPEKLGLPADPLSKASHTPPSKAYFENLPEFYARKTSYTRVKSAFTRYVLDKAKLTIYYHPKLKVYSKPGESLEEFKSRLQGIIAQKLREEEERVAAKYDAKLERIERRIESKKAQIERIKVEIGNMKAELGIAGVSALASITRLTSALSKASRIQNLRRRIASKEATLRKYEAELKSLYEEYKRIEEEKRRAMSILTQKLGGSEIREITVKPSRRNIDIEFLGILWVPRGTS